jgi:hypothetical protein
MYCRKILKIMRLLFLLLVIRPQLFPSDCNRNGIEDSVEIANGMSSDCNTNQIPDECELLPLSVSLEPSSDPPCEP